RGSARRPAAPAAHRGGQRRRARRSTRAPHSYAGHEVETAEDAPTALEKLRTFRPEIALIDIGLPGVDGYALARLARQTPEARATCLVALTGYGRPEDRKKHLA